MHVASIFCSFFAHFSQITSTAKNAHIVSSMAEVRTPVAPGVPNPSASSPEIPPANETALETALDTTNQNPPNDSKTLATTTTTSDATVTYFINAQGKRVKKIIRKKRRPARPQVDPATFKSNEPPPQTGTIFNIWYNKWSGGDREDAYLSKHAAPSRCSVAQDTGFTRADDTPGSYICLFFARGVCPKGRDCEYLHRLPNTFDIYSGNVDCFGREKHSEYRDDMGGVGSFSKQNRTLYVGRIHPTDDIEEIVSRHFAEWGKIERIRVLPSRGVAFVTYINESLAQFAKESMAHQSLDNTEILNVRWATTDPNPASQKREARYVEDQAAEAIRKALPPDIAKELGGDPEAKRRRVDEENFGLEGYVATDDVWFKSQKSKMALESAGQKAALGAPQERKLLGNGTDGTGAEEDAGCTTPDTRNQNQTGGLLGTSTLSALNGYGKRPSADANPTSSKVALEGTKAGKMSSGLLAGYASDDDE